MGKAIALIVATALAMMPGGLDGGAASDGVNEAPVSRYAALELTGDDIDLLARIVWLESRGEPVEGQQAVAEVVLNRMASDLFPNTMRGVIYQKGQFTTASKTKQATPSDVQYTAVNAALHGPYVLPMEVLFFSRGAQNRNVWGRIGDHVFCYSRFWEGGK